MNLRHLKDQKNMQVKRHCRCNYFSITESFPLKLIIENETVDTRCNGSSVHLAVKYWHQSENIVLSYPVVLPENGIWILLVLYVHRLGNKPQ